MADDLEVLGSSSLLRSPALGLLCSTTLPPSLLLPTFALIADAALRGVPVVSAFHSPMEADCLEVILTACGRAVVCPARRLGSAGPARRLAVPVGDGRVAVVSGFRDPRDRRVTAELAERRNDLVVSLAAILLIPHARPSSRTFRAAARALAVGTAVACFRHPLNTDLILLGARPVGALADLAEWLPVGPTSARGDSQGTGPSASGAARNSP